MAQDQAQRARHELLKAQAVAASDSRLREAAKAAAAAEATAANETVAAAEAVAAAPAASAATSRGGRGRP